MSEFAKNFKTDLKRVNWVRTEYAYPMMKKMEETIESLEADNKALKKSVNTYKLYISEQEAEYAKLKSENTRYEKHNKTLKTELNIWNESPVTEKVRELAAKVEILDGIIELSRIYKTHPNLMGELILKELELSTTNRGEE